MKIFGWGKQRIEKHKELAWDYFRAEDYRSAREEFARWTEIEPNSATAWFGFGYCGFVTLTNEGLKDQEISCICMPLLEKAIRLNRLSGELTADQQAMAFYFMGVMNKFLGESQAAEANFLEAVAVAPESGITVLVRKELAARSEEKGDLETVERLLTEILQIDPQDEEAKKYLQYIERRREGIEIIFRMWLPLPGLNTAVWAHPDETLGGIAARVLSEHGFSYTGGQFLYSGDEALPSYFSAHYREPHQTVRELGIKNRDTLIYIQLVDAPGTNWWTEAFGIRSAREHLSKGRMALARREIRKALGLVKLSLRDGDLDEAEAKITAILQLDSENPDAQSLRDQVLAALRERDVGSASADGVHWSHSHGGSTRTSQTACGPVPPLQQIWEFNTKPSRLSSPVIWSNQVCITSWDQRLYCLDADIGQVLWHWTAKTVMEQPPIVTDNAIYVADREAIYCLCARTRKLRWRYAAHRPSSPVLSSNDSAGNNIFFVDAEGKLYCLNAETGALLRSLETNELNLCSLALDHNLVIAASDHLILCADKNLNSVHWRREGRFDDAIPVLAYGNIYAGTFEEGLWCLEAESGRIRWLFSTEAQIKAAPAVSKGRIFFGDTSGAFGCADAFTGGLLWTPKSTGWNVNRIACSTAPVVAWPFVYIILNDGVLYSLNALTGIESWRGDAQRGQVGTGSLAVTAQAVYYATRSGSLVCLGSAEVAARSGSKPAKPDRPPNHSNLPPSLKDESSETESLGFKDYGRPTSLSRRETDDLHSALYHLMMDRLDEGIAILRRLQHDHPDEGIVLHNLGNAYEWKGLIGDALATFDHILSLYPDDALAFTILGRLLRTHPEMIQAIYGSPAPIYQQPLLDSAQSLQIGLTIAVNDNEPVVIVKADRALALNLGDSPAWYWWQLIETPYYPVLRLYLEFDYQPFRLYDLLLPLDIAEPKTEVWLDQLQDRESIVVHIYDLAGEYCISRRLDFPIEQRARLRSLLERSLRALGTLPVAARNFQSAVTEAQTIWNNNER